MHKKINRFKFRVVAAVAASLLVAHSAWAVDPFTVRDIRVEGLQRVEPGTIFASLPFRVGETYNDDKGTTAIRALFGLGLFKDVRLEVVDNILVVIVEECPTVADVNFVGSKEFSNDILKRHYATLGLQKVSLLIKHWLTKQSKNSSGSTLIAACMGQKLSPP